MLTAEAPAPLDTKRWVWISWALFRSTHPRRERRATAAHDSLRVRSRAGASKAPQRLASAPSLRTPRPRSFPCRRLGGSAASRIALAARTVRVSAAPLLGRRGRATAAHGRLGATLPASRLASPRGRSLWSSPRPLARGLRVRRLQPRTKSPRTVASTDVSNSRSSTGGTRAVWRAGGCGVWVRDGARRGGRLPRTRDRGARRGAARGARQVSCVRESCGSVGLRNVLHTFESGLIALAWVQGSEFI